VITLVLGGVRSGKSEVAERLAGPGPGTYLATGLVAPDDEDFAARVAGHRARRPAAWATVEEPRAVPAVLARLHGPVLLDALGTWIANDPRPDLDALIEALVSRRGDTVIVSEEVGLGVHPVTEVGRLFADRLGEANRRIAEVADCCLLVVAGRVIDLPAGDAPLSVFDAQPASEPHRPHWTPLEGPGADPTVPPTTPAATPTIPAAIAGLRQAVAFLTPLGGAITPTPAAFTWFPLVGALLGLALGGLWWALDGPLGPLGAAALVVAVDLAVTGALHFDGLLDSADGLLPHMRLERRLSVMADPTVGAFAVATGATTLLLRTAALASVGTAHPLLLAALWSLSRTAMAVTALTGRYARAHGLASSFLGAAENQPGTGGHRPGPAAPQWILPAAVGLILSVGLSVLDDPKAITAILAAALAAAAMAALARPAACSPKRSAS
jgi:adenosyl cobinamide kinase/adenosyl cobinamide phosphate guanylyltransferase/cobalamin synthase